MTDDKRKNMQKMEDDDLSAVSGGLNIFNRQSPNTGRVTTMNRTILSDSIGGDKMSAAGNLGQSAGLGTATAYCPRCGKETEHIVFNGGRGKCKECGLTQDKL